MSLNIKIVLVEPLYQGNVGSVTRVMKNFGFSDIVLVNPCKLEGEARAMSSHAHDVLESARITSSLAEAVENASIVIGTTGITGLKHDEHTRMPYYTPRELKKKLTGMSGTVAILFGREDQGFNNNELGSCDMILTIPTSDVYQIMNLSHAAGIVLYELSDIKAGDKPLARGFDLRLLYEHMGELLEDIDYPVHKKDKTMLMFKRIFGRAELIPREVQTLRGVIRRIRRKIKGDTFYQPDDQ
ncbi:MAG TPA: RNA methyltransferase [Methanosarcinaceae archaeon]|nr:RNA methyltransferase [Methanosarcinaceae archaeon]